MTIIETIQQKASFLNKLKENETALFEFINSNHDNLEEVIAQYKPEVDFTPVNTLRFLIANELQKGTIVNKNVIDQLKHALENRDVSDYYILNDSVKHGLINYKKSKIGMFPNWKHSFNILFPFIHNTSDNSEVKTQLNQLADEIISVNNLENVTKHIVSFQGSNNYGTDWIWLAILPESAPSVQYAYQIFINIDKKGLIGGIHKGHNLTKQEFKNQDFRYNSWQEYLEQTKEIKDEWLQLNSGINFIFLNDEKEFKKVLKKVNSSSLATFFETLDKLKDDLDFQDAENFVFSVARNRLSFQVGKRYCLALLKDKFRFITSDSYIIDNLPKEIFTAPDNAILYGSGSSSQIETHYEAIKDAVESEIERNNHTEPKAYDNSAFRKAVFDQEYRSRILNGLGIIFPNKGNMRNIKQDFIDWIIKKPKSNYFNNDKETLSRYLDIYNEYFDSDIFEVSKSNYKNIIALIEKAAYLDENSAFFKYSDGESNHRPRAILGRTNYYKFLEEIFNKSADVSSEHLSYYAPVNQIYYGPPGTGKTYSTILEAAKIIGQDVTINFEEAQYIFNNHLGDQIEFITFHQNYSYEDFIQGLRPDTESSGELSFFKSDGVFKKIADRALKNYKESNTEVKKKRSFSEVFEEFVFPLIEGEVTEIEIKMKKVSFYITNIKDKSIEFRKTSGGTDHTLSIGTLKDMYDEESTKDIQGLSSYYRPLLYELLKIGKLEETEHVTKKNYVIIIDEINRANISRVFGELITLLEKDKRYGGEIPIIATLPSGDKFIVPLNLYIIGTMNTADKSIALLDIALRRRFEFIPMYPDSKSTENKVVHNSDILDVINAEIISRKGHDFTIGHSYFMGEDYDLKNTIDNKVIPLLLEYFMNDFEEVKKILKPANLIVDGWPMKLISND